MLRIPLLSISLMLFSVTASAQATTQWVTDQLEVTLRSGPSTSNKILRIMNSGETVTLIEADDETKYSLVETANGEQGYVITRFLKSEPIAQIQLEALRESHQQQQQRVDEQANQIARLSEELQQANGDNEVLKTTLRASEQELTEIRETAQNTLNILEHRINQRGISRLLVAQEIRVG